ncbi:MAG: hypothetical protein ACFCU6_10200, partial [Balneolaceae bacterium]
KYRRKITDKQEIRFGPTFESIKVTQNLDKFVTTETAGLTEDDFKTHPILGFETTYQTSEKDPFTFHRRKFRFRFGSHFTYNFRDETALLKLNASTSIIREILFPDFVWASRAGVTANIGSYRFFQANTIGDTGVFFRSNSGFFDTANFRGMARDRFSGRTSMYHNTEFRYKLFQVDSYVLPGEFGILTLFDHGRVWTSGENSRVWHYAFGGGIWYNFFNSLVISATLAKSDVDTNASLLLGFMF